MLVSAAGSLLAVALAASSASSASPATSSVAPADAPLLDLSTIYVEQGGSLVLSPEVKALAGHAVRVRGFMVDLEEPPRGEFFLARAPVQGDESGGGTADVPVNAILVRVPGLEQAELPWRPGLLEVQGQLEVGRVEDAGGRASTLRLVLAEAPRR
jgi:hypothetical protein